MIVFWYSWTNGSSAFAGSLTSLKFWIRYVSLPVRPWSISGLKNWFSEPHVPDMITSGFHVGLLLDGRHGLGAERAGGLDQQHLGARGGERGELVVEVRRRRLVGLLVDDLDVGALRGVGEAVVVALPEVAVERDLGDLGQVRVLGLQPLGPQARPP